MNQRNSVSSVVVAKEAVLPDPTISFYTSSINAFALRNKKAKSKALSLIIGYSTAHSSFFDVVEEETYAIILTSITRIIQFYRYMSSPKVHALFSH